MPTDRAMDGKRDRIFWLLLAAALFFGAGRPASAQTANAGDSASDPTIRAQANPTAVSQTSTPEPAATITDTSTGDSAETSAWMRLAAGDADSADGGASSEDQPLPGDPDDARPLGDPGDRPDTTSDGGPNNWWLQTAVALAIVIGLIFLTRSGLRRLGGNVMPAPAGHLVEVLGRTSLGPKTSVMFLKLNHRILVVGQSASGMDTLTEIKDPEEVAMLLGQFDAGKPKSVSNSFRGLMGRLDRLYKGSDSTEAHGDSGSTTTRGLAGGERTAGPSAGHGSGRRVDGELDRTREQLSGLLGRMRALRRDEGEGGGER